MPASSSLRGVVGQISIMMREATTEEETVMAKTASDVLIETLLAWDVEVIFGMPGDGINGVIEALRVRSSPPA
jgi:hypothetical protein